MKGLWYRLLVGLSSLAGAWFFVLVSRIIAAGYFLFSSRVKESIRFYKLLYPEKSTLSHRYTAFCQYQNFTTIHLDRFLSKHRGAPRFSSEGWEKLENALENSGAILLMSHLGNWEMAAKLLRGQKKDMQLLLFMGVKEKESLEKMQKDNLRDSGVKIIGEEQAGGSPFSAVEGVRFLENGGLVSMTGDIVWREEQRKVPVNFLGKTVFLPEAPYIFSLVAGAPIFVFFAHRTGKNRYHFTLSDPVFVNAKTRAKRKQAISTAAQQYADLLEKAVRNHPLEWYHFERFLH